MSSLPGSQFPSQLGNLLRARFPFIYIPTWEEERVIDAIRRVAADEALVRTTRTVLTWSSTGGLLGEGQSPREDTRAPIRALEFIERYDEPALFVLKDFHPQFGGPGRQPDYTVIRKLRDLVPVLKYSPRPRNVLFLSPQIVLPMELQKDVTILEFDLPEYAEIRHLLEEMITANSKAGRIKNDLHAEETERLAKTALGLTLQEAENAFARAMVKDGRVSIADVDVILEEKRQIIQKTGVLEYVVNNRAIEEVGGLENLKRWLKRRNRSWLNSAQRYGLTPPKGVLITGVPGCGKSLIAKAVSSMWQLPLLRLDVGRLFSGIVGSSEENLRRAIQTAEAIAPAVLWIDEIEKGFATVGINGDSGTSARVFASFLTWMQEKTKPVFVVATANMIHALPPELLRKGRFDEIFFVDLPTRAERIEIFDLHLRQRVIDPAVKGDVEFGPATLEQLGSASEGFTGAEIEQVVISALFDAYSEDRAVTMSDLTNAIVNTVPLSVTQAEQIHAIRDWASLRAVSATPHADRAEYQLTGDSTQNGTRPSAAAEDIRDYRGGRTVDF